MAKITVKQATPAGEAELTAETLLCLGHGWQFYDRSHTFRFRRDDGSLVSFAIDNAKDKATFKKYMPGSVYAIPYESKEDSTTWKLGYARLHAIHPDAEDRAAICVASKAAEVAVEADKMAKAAAGHADIDRLMKPFRKRYAGLSDTARMAYELLILRALRRPTTKTEDK